MMLLRRYAAAWVLVSLALFFNVVHYYLETVVAPATGTRAYWLNTSVENLQSEVWQIAIAAFIFQHWKWQGSPEAAEQASNSGRALIGPILAVVVVLNLLFWVTDRGLF